MKIAGYTYRYEYPPVEPPLPYGFGLGDSEHYFWLKPPLDLQPSLVWRLPRLPVEEGRPAVRWLSCSEEEFPSLHAVAIILGRLDYLPPAAGIVDFDEQQFLARVQMRELHWESHVYLTA